MPIIIEPTETEILTMPLNTSSSHVEIKSYFNYPDTPIRKGVKNTKRKSNVISSSSWIETEEKKKEEKERKLIEMEQKKKGQSRKKGT